MADKEPFLEVVPYTNGSYYRLKGDKLIVLVVNKGDGPAKATTTRVDFKGYGTCTDPQNRQPQDQWTPPLDPGKSVALEFDPPSDDCFNPNCKFNITVDAKRQLGEGFTRVTFGVGRGPKLPDLVLVPDKNGKYGSQVGNKLEFQVQNQGTDYARRSTAKLEFDGDGEKKVTTTELEPGEETVLSFEIPDGLYKGGLEVKYKITLDADNVVKESNKNNNVAQGVCDLK